MTRSKVAMALALFALLSLGQVPRPAGGAPTPTTAPATVPTAKDPGAVRVLYVEGYPRWDYRYLVQWLVRDRGVVSSVYLASADPQADRPGDRPVVRLPETRDEADAYDVIIIGDVDPRVLTERQQAALVGRVEAGAGLVMLAGARFAPAAYRGTPLGRALPVEVAADVPPADAGVAKAGVRPALTAEGRRSVCFRFRHDPAENEKLVGALEPLFWYAPGVAARPGAAVWAEHPAPGPDGKRVPLVVAGTHGTGKVLYIGFDDTWRWRRPAGGVAVFDTFWAGAVRAVAPGPQR